MFVYALIAGIVVSSLALFAVWAFSLELKRLQSVLHFMVAFAAGALLGDVLLHMLPELNEVGIGPLTVGILIFMGAFVSLLIEAALHHLHHAEDDHGEVGHKHNEALPWMTSISAAAHNLLDGLAIGAAFLTSPVVGLSTTLAIIFHEIPHELSHVSVLFHAGWKPRRVLLVNFTTGLISLAGVVAAFVVSSLVDNASGALTAFAAGQLLYVAMADLIPEMHRRAKDSSYFWQIGMFVVGGIVMLGLKLLEK